ncbi:hypothetical protein ACIP4S_11645 [Streptomyces chartreusis]|uniref:hypothetical protein n=1 Tax=Streptomyces chartreusis TaxID=1969 RepID=UPI0037F89C26
MALLAYSADRAREEGLAGLTLTTSTEAPWNAPHYARLGFCALEEAELGLDRRPRVCMRRD